MDKQEFLQLFKECIEDGSIAIDLALGQSQPTHNEGFIPIRVAVRIKGRNNAHILTKYSEHRIAIDTIPSTYRLEHMKRDYPLNYTSDMDCKI